MTDKKELDMTEHEKCIHYPICLVNNYIHKRCGYYLEEPKQGEWIPCKDDNFCKCSECKQIVMSEERSNFCPNCGAKMLKPEDEPVKEITTCMKCGTTSTFDDRVCPRCRERENKT